MTVVEDKAKTTDTSDPFAMWAILELMGHRRLAGFVTEATIGGASFIRIDVPDEDGESELGIVSQFYSPSAVYCITPTTKEIVMRMAARNRPAPVQPWELPPPAPEPSHVPAELEAEDDDEPT